jgi:hypothetical protein
VAGRCAVIVRRSAITPALLKTLLSKIDQLKFQVEKRVDA